jgi:hypothetical protein
MPSDDAVEFLVFRYQLLPTRETFQPTLFPRVHSIEDLVRQKNAIFATVLEKTKDFSTGRVKLIHKQIAKGNHLFVIQPHCCSSASIFWRASSLGDGMKARKVAET